MRVLTAAGVVAALAGALAGCGGGSHHSATTTPQTPQFSTRSISTLAQGTLPGGQSFSIRSQKYSVGSRTYLALEVTTRSGGSTGFTPAQAHGPLAFADFGECSHRRFLVVYGLLRAAGDTVSLSAHGAEHLLRRAAVPAGVGAGGVLVYGLAHTPARLLVKSASGAVVASASLAVASHNDCPRAAGTFAMVAPLRGA